LYALINDKEIPVESLRSIVGSGRTVLIAGATESREDRMSVQKVLSGLHKKDVVLFSVVTSDWRTISGNAVVTDLVAAAKSETRMPFFVAMKRTNRKNPDK